MSNLTTSMIKAAFPKSSAVGIEGSWPLIQAALIEFGIDNLAVEIAAAATVQVEVGVKWLPIAEKLCDPHKNPAVYAQQMHYWLSGFYGRGYIQLTKKLNYALAGQALKLDLLGHPELAFEPTTAARVLAWFFRANHIAVHANAGQWVAVRQTINGGDGVDAKDGGRTNGLNDFLAAVQALQASALPNLT